MRRVADQMLSAHSALRDRYRRRSLGLTLLIIALSIVGASLAFVAGESRVTIAHVHATLARWVGVLSLGIFFLGMLDLVFDWRVRAHVHGEAAVKLGELKQRLRTAPADDVGLGSDEATAAYQRTMSLLPPIPDGQFAPLKARHAYKVALSREIDSHAGSPIWFLRLKVRFDGMRGRADESGGPSLEILDSASSPDEGSADFTANE